jgi:hypothetical protein
MVVTTLIIIIAMAAKVCFICANMRTSAFSICGNKKQEVAHVRSGQPEGSHLRKGTPPGFPFPQMDNFWPLSCANGHSRGAYLGKTKTTGLLIRANEHPLAAYLRKLAPLVYYLCNCTRSSCLFQKKDTPGLLIYAKLQPPGSLSTQMDALVL